MTKEEIKPVEIQSSDGTRIVLLFLEKLEKLNDKERQVLIHSIDLLNHPLFKI